jgi:hypothetical protein
LQPFTDFCPEQGVKGSSLFSVELRPEPTAEKKAVNDRLIPSPSPRPLPKGEGEPLGSSGRAECAKAFGRVGDGRAAVAPSFGAWDRSRHSPSLDEAFACSPSPRGRGRGEGEGFVRFSIASSILQVALIPPKIAKNLPVFERSFITNDLQNELLGKGRALEQHWRIRTLRLPFPLLCLSFRRRTTTNLGRIVKSTGECFSLSWGRGLGWVAGTHMGNTPGTYIGNT